MEKEWARHRNPRRPEKHHRVPRRRKKCHRVQVPKIVGKENPLQACTIYNKKHYVTSQQLPSIVHWIFAPFEKVAKLMLWLIVNDARELINTDVVTHFDNIVVIEFIICKLVLAHL
mmetsp:Transcript_17019/g.21757  ORF Transcript_17019/g.21757 Transcript_17019/m.21757 type:complete len:116 (+) Transcript_17019:696-1043(+)